jgi:hypothetical protein
VRAFFPVCGATFTQLVVTREAPEGFEIGRYLHGFVERHGHEAFEEARRLKAEAGGSCGESEIRQRTTADPSTASAAANSAQDDRFVVMQTSDSPHQSGVGWRAEMREHE